MSDAAREIARALDAAMAIDELHTYQGHHIDSSPPVVELRAWLDKIGDRISVKVAPNDEFDRGYNAAMRQVFADLDAVRRRWGVE